MEPLKDTVEEAYWFALMQDDEALHVEPAAALNGRIRSAASDEAGEPRA